MNAPGLPDDLPPERLAEADVTVRYEDVTQDGRFRLAAMPNVFGPTVWGQLVSRDPAARALIAAGIVPILTRLVIEGTGGPVGIMSPVQAKAGYDICHALNAEGAVDRVFLTMWAEIHGRKGRAHPPAPADAGAPVHLGRVFSQNTFTRPFAPAGQRRVTSLPGLADPPGRAASWEAPEGLLDPPDGVELLDDDWVVDDVPFVFGLDHTDGNQHVNSLVYPALFQDVALRRFAALGLQTALVSRFVDVRYRKPCFAGQAVRPVVRAFVQDGRPGVFGLLAPVDGSLDRPYCTIRIGFAP